MKLAQWLQTAWYKKNHPVLYLLRPLEWLYRRVVDRKFNHYLSQNPPSYRAAVPVVVVGNITVGGTGKTPTILWLIHSCQSLGLKVGVVSRGYGARPPQFPWRVTSTDNPVLSGDEPLLIVKRTQVPLVIDPDRGQAAQFLLEQEAVDVILSDDGLQHYRLARDLELVLIDAARGLGNQRCLPAGPLREPKERLQTVDAVLINGAKADSLQGFAMQLQPTQLINLKTGQISPLTELKEKTVNAVAGIGNPQRFFDTLMQLGCLVLPKAFNDHANYTEQDLVFENDFPVVMTEKDAVKCQAFARENWWYVAVDAQPSEAFQLWWSNQLQRLVQLKKEEPSNGSKIT